MSTQLNTAFNEVKQHARYAEYASESYGPLFATAEGKGILDAAQQTVPKLIHIVNKLGRMAQEYYDGIDGSQEPVALPIPGQNILISALSALETHCHPVDHAADSSLVRLNLAGTPMLLQVTWNESGIDDGKDTCFAGLEQFLGLVKPVQGTAFRTPQPYFATRYCCAMADLQYPTVTEFGWKDKAESFALQNYLARLAAHDPLNARPDSDRTFVAGYSRFKKVASRGEQFAKGTCKERFMLATPSVNIHDIESRAMLQAPAREREKRERLLSTATLEYFQKLAE